MMMISWTKKFNFDITHHSFAYLIQLINSETVVLSAGWLDDDTLFAHIEGGLYSI